MKPFAPYFELEESGAKASDLKEKYKDIQVKFPDLPHVNTKDTMRTALREYEEKNPNKCEPLESGDQFYGWSRGANLLSKHIQWVYLPAVKDPTEEQDEQRNSALGNLLQRTIRSQIDFSESIRSLRVETSEKYQSLLKEQDKELEEISKKLQIQLQNWAHPGARVLLNWHYDDQKSVTVSEPYARAKVGEGDFIGEIVRLGHGIQRSFLISLLQVLANLEEGERPLLLLGFEEPDLYQHPPQAKHLASLLENLSKQDNQIIVTTHSPYFVSSKGYEQIRMTKVQNSIGGNAITQLNYMHLSNILADALGEEPSKPTEVMAAVEQIMQPSQSELFFCRVPILVEGPEDVAFISTYLQYKDKWNVFRRLGCHFVVCNGKTNMSRPLAIANGFKLPAFLVFDGDCDKAKGESEEGNKRDNGCILKLAGIKSDPIINEPLYCDNLIMWDTRILDVIKSAVGNEVWDKEERRSREVYKLQEGVRQKNPILIAAITESLLSSGVSIKPLELTVEKIITYAERATV